MMTKASVLSLLAVTTAIFCLMFGTASADCLVEGDMLFVEGQSMGHIGVECLNSTSYTATDTVCGPDGEMIESPAVYTCPTSDPEFDPDGLYAAPFCVQCSPPGPGSALCLSSPDLPSDCVGVDDDEDFLPQATPAPNAEDAGSFDQCEDEADVEIWTNGGAANRPANSDYCSREFNGGCYLDSACIETCFQETYGYSAKCSTCFGAIPTCSVSSGCMDVCMFDSLGEDCAECNAPCVEEFNECTGLPTVTAGPEVDSLPAPTASPATNGPSFPGGETTTTLSPTVVCGADEEGCVDENYRVTYCIPASDGPCPCPEGMTRCPTYDMGTWTAGGYCQPVCCDDGPDGTEVACPDDLFGNFWNVTYCEPIAKGCGEVDSLPSPTASPAPSSPSFPGGGTTATLLPTVTMTVTVGTWKTAAPTAGGTTPFKGDTFSPTPTAMGPPTDGMPTASQGPITIEGMPTASPVPTTSPSPPSPPLKSSAPKARLVTASTTVLLVTLLYLS